MLKRRGFSCFQVASTWNTHGVFEGFLYECKIGLIRINREELSCFFSTIKKFSFQVFLKTFEWITSKRYFMKAVTIAVLGTFSLKTWGETLKRDSDDAHYHFFKFFNVIQTMVYKQRPIYQCKIHTAKKPASYLCYINDWKYKMFIVKPVKLMFQCLQHLLEKYAAKKWINNKYFCTNIYIYILK